MGERFLISKYAIGCSKKEAIPLAQFDVKAGLHSPVRSDRLFLEPFLPGEKVTSYFFARRTRCFSTVTLPTVSGEWTPTFRNVKESQECSKNKIEEK